jgi:hypothetical protein
MVGEIGNVFCNPLHDGFRRACADHELTHPVVDEMVEEGPAYVPAV